MVRTKYPLFKWMHKGQRGFTLVELLVVIAILGVVAAVAIPNVTRFVGRGETEAQKAEMHNVLVAVSAAVYEGNGICETFDGSAGMQGNPSGTELDDPSTYLQNDTTWMYVVTANGTTTRPNTTKATTWVTGT